MFSAQLTAWVPSHWNFYGPHEKSHVRKDKKQLLSPKKPLPQSPGETLCCKCCTWIPSHRNGSVGGFCSFPSGGNPFRKIRKWKACNPCEFSCVCWGLNSGWRLSHMFHTYEVSPQCGWLYDDIELRLDGILYHKPYKQRVWLLKINENQTIW